MVDRTAQRSERRLQTGVDQTLERAADLAQGTLWNWSALSGVKRPSTRHLRAPAGYGRGVR